MENEPVKVKMQLHAARPSIQGAAPACPAAQAAVEAVEARWRAEDKKAKAGRRKKGCVGCLSWLFLLLVAAGVAWYFLGEKYLPPEYAFPQVWQKVKDWWGPPPPPPVQKDPVDEKTAAERAKVRDFVSQLEALCEKFPPRHAEAIGIKAGDWQVGQKMLNEIVSADNWYFKANTKLEEMEAQNEKLQKLRLEERSAKRRQYAAQYRPELINRQRNEIERKLADCKRIRAQVTQRAIRAVKVASSQWTGPESRKDAARLLRRLDVLAKQFKDKKVTVENHHEGVTVDSRNQKLETIKQKLENINQQLETRN